MALRVSHETDALRRLEEALADLGPATRVFKGYGAENRDSLSYDLQPIQYLQFGDLRVETDERRVVVEVESAGGMTNLVKYWKLLAETTDRRPFLLLHLYRTVSANDYVAHQQVWRYVVDRLRADLTARGPAWMTDWAAMLGTYQSRSVDVDMDRYAGIVRSFLHGGVWPRA